MVSDVPVKPEKPFEISPQVEGVAELRRRVFRVAGFAMLRRLDCRVEVEPHFPNTGGTVEFCATIGRERFYIEATVCSSGPSTMGSNVDEEDAIQKIRGGLDVPHSDLWLSATGELRRTLSRERVLRRFRKLLREYTADQVKRFYSEHGPAWTQIHLSDSIKEGDWVLDGYLAPPMAPDGRGQVRGPSRGGAVDGSKQLKGGRLEEEGTRRRGISHRFECLPS